MQDRKKKNNKNLYLYYPGLTAYPDEIDPGRRGILDFGFPELMVRDIDNPLESFRDATIKCWYTDRQYKAVIVSASGKEQGRVFEDGVGYLDAYMGKWLYHMGLLPMYRSNDIALYRIDIVNDKAKENYS